MRIVWMLLLMACGSWAQGAQNMELSWTLGGITSSSLNLPGNTPGTSLVLSGSAGFATQVSYAYQLPKPTSGHVWFEIPVTFTFRGTATIVGPDVSTLDRNVWFVTPGLRFKTPTFKRVSFYGAVGGGLGAFSDIGSDVNGTNGTVFTNNSVHPHPVFDFAGGIDVRLSRLLSLRGEVRDFVSAANLGGVSGHTHPAALIGLAFHL